MREPNVKLGMKEDFKQFYKNGKTSNSTIEIDHLRKGRFLEIGVYNRSFREKIINLHPFCFKRKEPFQAFYPDSQRYLRRDGWIK